MTKQPGAREAATSLRASVSMLSPFCNLLGFHSHIWFGGFRSVWVGISTARVQQFIADQSDASLSCESQEFQVPLAGYPP